MKSRPLLDSIQGPADVRRLERNQLPDLAREIREELIDVVSLRGGHLASNLGVVELTIALVYVFDLDSDNIIWDTGHQGYVYKLLTGRRKLFQSLRQDDGCCGFLHRDESPYDVFGAGHAGTAVSAATGFAAARDFQGGDNRVVAVLGDGAMGCGASLEGLNNIIESTKDLVLVLNDNKMSIAPNVGALSRYLNRLISGQHYNRLKGIAAETVARIPKVGFRIRDGVRRVEEAAKGMLIPGLIFEELGLRYMGPLDGHDVNELVDTFANVRKLRQPLVVHVLTEKGHGYTFAEQSPETFHGMSAFDRGSGEPLQPAGEREQGCTDFSDAFGTCLKEQLEHDARVVAITAGMCKGTGLKDVRETLPERLCDVGIAEEHAVVFAAGMAAAGMKPVVAIYASFMQRAMDYVFHDVCLQNLPVVFCLDRSGIVADGPTHHGIYDLPFWRQMPNLNILQPADGAELRQMLAAALARNEPALIRYPKGDAAAVPGNDATLVWGKAAVLREGDHVSLWCLGREAERGLTIAQDLEERGIQATVVNPRFVKPFDADLLRQHAERMPVVTIEDHAIAAGFGNMAAAELVGCAHSRLLIRGWPEDIVPWGSDDGIRAKFRLTSQQLSEDIAGFVKGMT